MKRYAYQESARDLIRALQAGLDEKDGVNSFWQKVADEYPMPVDLPDGAMMSPLAPFVTRLLIEIEMDKGLRPPTAASTAVGHIMSVLLGVDEITQISEIDEGQAQAHQMLAPLLEQPIPPVLIKAMINRLTLALARRTGSVDHALLFLMTTIDRSSLMDDDPPPAPPGLAC
jgi:hypothetical protein